MKNQPDQRKNQHRGKKTKLYLTLAIEDGYWNLKYLPRIRYKK